MKNVEYEIGENAGKLWQVLHEQGPLHLTKLIRTTKLSHEQLYEAIGWLARENKISKDNSSDGGIYTLGNTNLVEKIGTDAGKVWKALRTNGECSVMNIARITQINLEDIDSALGWLARENKIHVSNKHHHVMFSLIEQEQKIPT